MHVRESLGKMEHRNATKEDASRIVSLVEEVYETLPFPHYGSVQSWQEFVEKNDSFIGIGNDEVVGHIALASQEDYGVLCRSFVKPGYQNRGVFKELNKLRDEVINQKSFRYLEAQGTTHNTVIQNSLLSRGFETVGLELCVLPDIVNIGQRGSLVGFRKPISDAGVIPTEIPEYREGFVPSSYKNGWQYAPIGECDFSKVRLHPVVVEKLNLRI